MKLKRKAVHATLLLVEFSILFFFTLNSTCFGYGDSNHVVRQFGCIPLVLLAVGLAMWLIVLLFRATLSIGKRQIIIIIMAGFVFVLPGAFMCESSRPIYKLFGTALSAKERTAKFRAVQVLFDANGGSCDESRRVVKNGGIYGGVMNLYPSEDIRNFTFIRGVSLSPRFGVFYLKADNHRGEMPFVNYFSAACIDSEMIKGQWRYVVEMLSVSGKIQNWVVGSTPTGGVKECAQLTLGNVGIGICTPEVKFITVTGQEADGEVALLDRAFMHLDDGESVDGRFRVSLFAGTGVNESNYHYVGPGETLSCSLPVPIRDGYEFIGWCDGNEKIVDSSKVVRREAHTLKASWRKL